MMSLDDMFYGPSETLWVVKSEKEKDNKKPEDKVEPTPLEKNFGKFYPYYYPEMKAPPEPAKKPPAEKTVDLKVPICCGECEEAVIIALKKLKGFKKVTCSIRKEKVTVVVSNDTSPQEVVLACRGEFSKSRLWTADD